MFWLLLSALFFWFARLEVRWNVVAGTGGGRSDWSRVRKRRLASVVAMALAFLWLPVDMWRIERSLTPRVRELTGSARASLQCRVVDMTLASLGAAAYADLPEERIVLAYDRCWRLMRYRAHPERANDPELRALNILTHEAMHLRGELNEARAECQAVQRNAQTARLLGVPDAVARRNAHDYYRRLYGHLVSEQYVSDECAPGKAMDEGLPDPPWTAP